jgi:hypothetical protein
MCSVFLCICIFVYTCPEDLAPGPSPTASPVCCQTKEKNQPLRAANPLQKVGNSVLTLVPCWTANTDTVNYVAATAGVAASSAPPSERFERGALCPVMISLRRSMDSMGLQRSMDTEGLQRRQAPPPGNNPATKRETVLSLCQRQCMESLGIAKVLKATFCL